MELITPAECARQLNFSKQYLSKLIRAGKVPSHAAGKRRKVNLDEVRAAIQLLKDPGKAPQRAWTEEQKGKGAAKAADDRTENQDGIVTEGEKEGPLADPVEGAAALTLHSQLAKMKIARESLASKKLQMEIRKAEGQLLDLNEVISENQIIDNVIRSKLIALPNRVAPRLAVIKNKGQIKTILEDEINSILEELYVMRGSEE